MAYKGLIDFCSIPPTELISLTEQALWLDVENQQGDGFTGANSLIIHMMATAIMMREGAEFFPELSPALLDLFFLIGWLHDWGKKMVKMSLLGKIGKLSLEEIAEIHRHTTLEYVVEAYQQSGIDPDSIPPYILEACTHHHKDLDGGGYPEEIILPERIYISTLLLMGVDRFEAGTSHMRPWQPPEEPEELLRKLEKDASDGKLCALSVGAIRSHGRRVELTDFPRIVETIAAKTDKKRFNYDLEIPLVGL